MRRHSFKGLCDSCASVSQVGELACRSWVVSIVLRSSDWMVDSAACFGSVSSYVQLSGRGLRLVQQQCLITCCTSLLCSSLCWLISKFSSGLVTLVQKFGGSSCAGVETISLLSRCEVWSSLRSFLCFLADSTLSSDCVYSDSGLVSAGLLFLHSFVRHWTLLFTSFVWFLQFTSSREALFLSPGSAATDYLHRSTVYN